MVSMEQKFQLIDWEMLDAFGQTRFLWSVDIYYEMIGGKIEISTYIKKV